METSETRKRYDTCENYVKGNFAYRIVKGGNLRHDHVLITVNVFTIKENNLRPDKMLTAFSRGRTYVTITSVSKENKLRPDKKSATSSVLQGRFQCHKKQLARINVIDLKLLSLVYEI